MKRPSRSLLKQLHQKICIVCSLCFLVLLTSVTVCPTISTTVAVMESGLASKLPYSRSRQRTFTGCRNICWQSSAGGTNMGEGAKQGNEKSQHWNLNMRWEKQKAHTGKTNNFLHLFMVRIQDIIVSVAMYKIFQLCLKYVNITFFWFLPTKWDLLMTAD